MRFKFSLFVFMFSLASISLAQTFPVSLTVTCIKPYCGGARPSAEMEEMARTPQGYANKTVILVNLKGKSTKLKTNSEGQIICSLKAGEYKFYENWRKCKKTPDGQSKKKFDKSCLQLEWQKEFAIITISSGSVVYSITNDIVEVCEWNRPCVLEKYRGQAPE